MNVFDSGFLMADKRFYESLNRVPIAEGDFISLLRRDAPSDWRIVQKNPWVQCVSPAGVARLQGWKLHVSACADNSSAVLAACIPVLFASGTTFKCAADERMLRYLNNKNLSRGSGGKFMTIYPADDAEFERLAAALAAATAGLIGPFILSDRRYRDSRTVYYRYGGFALMHELKADGTYTPLIRHPDGSLQPDKRNAFPTIPAGITDPFESSAMPSESASDDGEPGTLRGGRYKIMGVLKFSNAGGVYRALDRRTGRDVVIKEARPGIFTAKHESVQDSLRKEFRLLCLFADDALGPSAVELFEDWEHLFLVEEYIAGQTLGEWLGDEALLLRPAGAPARAAWLERSCDLLRQLCDIVAKLHARGVTFCDLSPNNVMLEDASGRIRLIDFESAFQAGVDRPSVTYTGGFAPHSVIFDGERAPSDDVYALGALCLAIVAPVTELFEQVPAAAPTTIAKLAAAAGMPKRLEDALIAALSQNAADRPSVAALAASLSQGIATRPPSSFTYDERELEADIDAALRFIESVSAAHDPERLFPSDLRMYATNPVNLAFGAAGTLAMLHRANRPLAPQSLRWLREKTAQTQLAPGLAVGACGVATAMLHIGLIDEAVGLMRSHRDHPLLTASSLYSGLSGWGLANLRFFSALGDEAYLAEAISTADRLLSRSQTDARGRCWPGGELTAVGLMHGGSGAALFLLHLGLIVKREVYVRAGREALDFDIAHALRTPQGGLMWGATTVAKRGLPFWEIGSAGVGTVVAAYVKATGDESLRAVFEAAYAETELSCGRAVGKWRGLAGIGTFHLDCFDLFGEERFRASARRVAGGILVQRLVQAEGVAFPGRQQSRISCDYAQGMAGTLAFLQRITAGGPDIVDLVPESLTARAMVCV